jgi:C4-dicarboxylate-specific signal transduction histidine kinase
MNFTTVMGFTAGLLQFVVAGYALRLNRLFGTRRVGWSLFWAFLLLALLHLMQSVMEHNAGEEIGIKIDAMNVLISMLLLIGMVHLEALLKERLRVEREELRMRGELESEVKKKTAYLTRALEELQTEIDERKRMESVAQSARWELDIVSRRAELAKIAASVIQTVGDMLKSVRSARQMAAKQTDLLKELDSINSNLEKIQSMEQDCVKQVGEMDSIKPAEAA